VLERTLLSHGDNELFPVPNVLLTSAALRVPVVNALISPCVLRKGEVIGVLEDPPQFFTLPKDEHERARLQEAATRTA
jgi:hypothetical protein